MRPSAIPSRGRLESVRQESAFYFFAHEDAIVHNQDGLSHTMFSRANFDFHGLAFPGRPARCRALSGNK